MISLINNKTKTVRQYTDKKAKLILENPLLSGMYSVVKGETRQDDPPEVSKVSIKPKKNK